MTDKRFSRRDLIKRTATAAAVFTIVPRHVLGGTNHAPPSERLNIAGIGVGGQGGHDMSQVAKDNNVVALCDVDDKQGAKSFGRWPDARRYKDFRVMLEKEKTIDAVVVATPDHVHAVAAMTAIELGKHVYVEKPMAHSVSEVRALMAAAERYKVVTQMGNQGHSATGCRILETWIEDRAIGDVREVHCWTNRPTWPQGLTRPTDTPPAPATLDWDLWLGPAPARPYHRAYAPRVWRGWWDFGTGALGDMGCHIMDPAFSALKLGAPTRIAAESGSGADESPPLWSVIRYEFPKRGPMPPVTLTWHDGGKMPERPPELEEGRRMGDEGGGSLLMGTKGAIMCGIYSNSMRIIPEEKMRAYKRPPRPPRIPGHHRGWVLACKGEGETRSHFGYAGPLSEMVLLGNVALRVGRPIEWDGADMRVTNAPEAEQYVKHAYRDGWTL